MKKRRFKRRFFFDVGASVLAGAAEAARTAIALGELVDDIELGLHDRHDHELRQALERVQDERLVAAVPRRHHQLALVVRVDQPDGYAHPSVSQSAGTPTHWALRPGSLRKCLTFHP